MRISYAIFFLRFTGFKCVSYAIFSLISTGLGSYAIFSWRFTGFKCVSYAMFSLRSAWHPLIAGILAVFSESDIL